MNSITLRAQNAFVTYCLLMRRELNYATTWNLNTKAIDFCVDDEYIEVHNEIMKRGRNLGRAPNAAGLDPHGSHQYGTLMYSFLRLL